jgi:NTP pyrophosphatase (non-canonical NTP hydrolase)
MEGYVMAKLAELHRKTVQKYGGLDTIDFGIDKLNEEFEELMAEVYANDYKRILEEALDVANVAVRIAEWAHNEMRAVEPWL